MADNNGNISPKTRQKYNKENRKSLMVKDFRFLLRDSVGTLSYYATPFSYGLNVQGLWSSWLPLVDKSELIRKFGGKLSVAGFFLGAPQTVRTVVVMVENLKNGETLTENLTEGEIMSSVSTILSGIGYFGVLFGVITVPATITALGVSAAVIGVTSIFLNDNYGTPYRTFELDNGLLVTIILV